MNGWAIRATALTASLAAHAWLLAASGQSSAAPRRRLPPAFVQLTVAAAEPAAAPEPAPPPELPPPKSAPQPVISRAKPAAAPEPPPPMPAEAPAPPPELTGTTLLADAGQEGWSAPQGTGNARDGMVRSGAVSTVAPRVAPQPASQALRPPQTQQLPEALPLSQLSRKPVPPPLTAALERNYPAAARSIGQSGDAAVRARVEANGQLRLANIVVESAPGFGDACRRTLLASQWSAPLDHSGKPVATWITYRCKFRIDR